MSISFGTWWSPSFVVGLSQLALYNNSSAEENFLFETQIHLDGNFDEFDAAAKAAVLSDFSSKLGR